MTIALNVRRNPEFFQLNNTMRTLQPDKSLSLRLPIWRTKLRISQKYDILIKYFILNDSLVRVSSS